jgi:hypothetical protein
MRISLALTLVAYIGALIITAPTSASSAPLALSDQLAGSLETSEVLIQKVRRWSRRGYYAPYYYPYYRPYYQPYYYYRPYYRPYYPYYRPYYRPYPYYY